MDDSSPQSETGGEEASLARLRGRPLLDGLATRMPDAIPRSEIALALGAELALFAPEPDRGLIAEAARLHEVGKLYLPRELLARPVAALSAGERERLAAQHEHGRRVALGAGVPARACSWILHARERWDGAGPGGLDGEEIPLGSRVIAVCSTYLDTPVAPGENDPQALRDAAASELESCSGTVLDPTLARRAIELSGGRTTAP